MINQLEGHITQEQIDCIVNIIKNRYEEYKELVNTEKFKKMFLEEYKSHNKQFSVSWTISSAFPSDTTVAGNLNITNYIYSKSFHRPLLSNTNIKIFILNETTHFHKAKYLQEFYRMNENNFSNNQLFCYLKFSVKKQELQNIILCLPNENGQVVKEEVLYNK